MLPMSMALRCVSSMHTQTQSDPASRTFVSNNEWTKSNSGDWSAFGHKQQQVQAVLNTCDLSL